MVVAFHVGLNPKEVIAPQVVWCQKSPLLERVSHSRVHLVTLMGIYIRRTSGPFRPGWSPSRLHRKASHLTHHDDKTHIDMSNTATSNDNGGAVHPEDVTREQGGQFAMESDSIDGPPEDAVEAQQDARIEDDSVDTINALQVTMDRSGAEYIHAQKVFLNSSGAKSIEGDASKLTQSGVLQLRVDKATFHQSSAILVASQELQVESGSIVFGASGKTTLQQGARVSVMQTGSVEAEGDVRAFMLVSNRVQAGGDVVTTMDTRTAAVFGAVFGAVFAFIWSVIRRG